MFDSWQFSKTHCITNYGSGWWKDVVNQCSEFDPEVDTRSGDQPVQPDII